ncbi:hypothetical protein SAMN05216267_105220 [Actinacidiphila rubida]|uniref:Uncharacterized protein n=1 Tax=Actinacidiphila rubida TaxID=310780 RepID=A0A1H8TF48_9ACTN|nr:hypothetical protein SAMN05216267_105220 [Actinacidiphila rubida]
MQSARCRRRRVPAAVAVLGVVGRTSFVLRAVGRERVRVDVRPPAQRSGSWRVGWPARCGGCRQAPRRAGGRSRRACWNLRPHRGSAFRSICDVAVPPLSGVRGNQGEAAAAELAYVRECSVRQGSIRGVVGNGDTQLAQPHVQAKPDGTASAVHNGVGHQLRHHQDGRLNGRARQQPVGQLAGGELASLAGSGIASRDQGARGGCARLPGSCDSARSGVGCGGGIRHGVSLSCGDATTTQAPTPRSERRCRDVRTMQVGPRQGALRHSPGHDGDRARYCRVTL